MKFAFPLSLLILLVGCAVLVGCQADDLSPAKAVENYFTTLIAKDAVRLATLSCSAWEANARTDLESFGAVTAELSDLACFPIGEEGEYTLVNCDGKIVANYGDEVLEIDLSNQTYQVLYEGGEWRMCGYR